MALPNGAGGYQVGDGNINDPIIDLIDNPVSITTAQTLTAAQLFNGLIFVNSGITASVAYTLPTVADFETALVNSDRIGTTLTFRVVNLGTSSGTAVITTNTGWTISGSLTMTLPVASSGIGGGAQFVARKSAAGAWTLYRVV
jgi:hypothetical protein